MEKTNAEATVETNENQQLADVPTKPAKKSSKTRTTTTTTCATEDGGTGSAEGKKKKSDALPDILKPKFSRKSQKVLKTTTTATMTTDEAESSTTTTKADETTTTTTTTVNEEEPKKLDEVPEPVTTIDKEKGANGEKEEPAKTEDLENKEDKEKKTAAVKSKKRKHKAKFGGTSGPSALSPGVNTARRKNAKKNEQSKEEPVEEAVEKKPKEVIEKPKEVKEVKETPVDVPKESIKNNEPVEKVGKLNKVVTSKTKHWTRVTDCVRNPGFVDTKNCVKPDYGESSLDYIPGTKYLMSSKLLAGRLGNTNANAPFVDRRPFWVHRTKEDRLEKCIMFNQVALLQKYRKDRSSMMEKLPPRSFHDPQKASLETLQAIDKSIGVDANDATKKKESDRIVSNTFMGTLHAQLESNCKESAQKRDKLEKQPVTPTRVRIEAPEKIKIHLYDRKMRAKLRSFTTQDYVTRQRSSSGPGGEK